MRRSPVCSMILLITIIGLLSITETPAQGCQNWDLNGPFQLEGPAGTILSGSFTQVGEKLSGGGDYPPRVIQLDDPSNRKQTSAWLKVGGTLAEGYVVGSRVTFQISFVAETRTMLKPPQVTTSTAGTKIYAGAIDADGRVSGIYSDTRSPIQIPWSLHAPARCGTPAPAPPGRAGPPFRRSPSIFTPLVSKKPCRTGFEWRLAVEGDFVCVPPDSKTRAASENAWAYSNVLPNGQCKPGFVWREVTSNDHVCVTPVSRTLIRQEDRLAESRTQR